MMKKKQLMPSIIKDNISLVIEGEASEISPTWDKEKKTKLARVDPLR
jgi:hypothetical protein